MRAIFIIPVHCTDPVELLYAEHLKKGMLEITEAVRLGGGPN